MEILIKTGRLARDEDELVPFFAHETRGLPRSMPYLQIYISAP
jgi:hypothetical protein